MDEFGQIELPVPNGKQIKKNFVGKNLANYDSILVFSHFKGHIMGGFGGAMKNTSIGIASRYGKEYITAQVFQSTNGYVIKISS